MTKKDRIDLIFDFMQEFRDDLKEDVKSIKEDIKEVIQKSNKNTNKIVKLETIVLTILFPAFLYCSKLLINKVLL